MVMRGAAVAALALALAACVEPATALSSRVKVAGRRGGGGNGGAPPSPSGFDGMVDLGSYCTGGYRFPNGVELGFQDSAIDERCADATIVKPDESMSVFHNATAGGDVIIAVQDNWGLDQGRVTRVCVTPNAGATEQCTTMDVPIADKEFVSFVVPGITGAFLDPLIKVQLVPFVGLEDEFFVGDYQIWAGVIANDVPAPGPEHLVAGFSMIVYGDASIASGSIGGRLAVGGNLVASTSLSIGSDICQQQLDVASLGPGAAALPCAGSRPWSLLVAKDATWNSGALYPAGAPATCPVGTAPSEECAFVANNVLGSPGAASPLNTQLCNKTATGPCESANCLDAAFAESQTVLVDGIANSHRFSTIDVTYESKWSGIILTCTRSNSRWYQFTIPRAEWNAASWFGTTADCNPLARWTIVLIDSTGSDIDEPVVFNGGSFPARDKETYIIVEGSPNVTIGSGEVVGSLIAPQAHVIQNGGNLRGEVTIGSYVGNAAAQRPLRCDPGAVNTDDILVAMGAAVRFENAPDAGRRRQATTNPSCVPDDVIIVPAHGPIRVNDTVRVGGSAPAGETAIVAELLYVGPGREPAFRFTAPLTGNYPSRTAPVEGVVVANKGGVPTIRSVDTWCSATGSTNPPSESAASPALAIPALAATAALAVATVA